MNHVTNIIEQYVQCIVNHMTVLFASVTILLNIIHLRYVNVPVIQQKLFRHQFIIFVHELLSSNWKLLKQLKTNHHLHCTTNNITCNAKLYNYRTRQESNLTFWWVFCHSCLTSTLTLFEGENPVNRYLLLGLWKYELQNWTCKCCLHCWVNFHLLSQAQEAAMQDAQTQL